MKPATSSHLLFGSVVLLYSASLVFAYQSIPGAPSNDVVEEALSGYLMVRDGDYAPIYTKLNPHGHEFLYVLLTGVLVHAWGPGLLAILVPAWISTLAFLVLLYLFASQNRPLLDPLITALIALSFLWLFHYARTGLRTVVTPMLFMVFLLLLQAAVRRSRSWSLPLAAGCVLALGTYAYTSFRVAVVAFAGYAAIEAWLRWRVSREALNAWLRQSLLTLAGFLLVSMWGITYALKEPGKFLARGSYVVLGDWQAWATNLLYSFALPIHYSERYEKLAGPGYWFDPVAIALADVGLQPIPSLLGIAFFGGLLAAWRNRSDPVLRFLAVFYLIGTLLLGFTGPSLTRMLILVPTYAIVAGAGLKSLPTMFRGQRFVLRGALAAIALLGILSYFRADPPSDASKPYGAEMAAAVAKRTRELCADQKRPVCIVSQDRNVVRYLTIGHWDRYSLHEFHHRPVDPNEVGDEMRSADLVLVDRGRQVRPLVRSLTRSGAYARADGDLFFEFVRKQ